MADDFTFAKPSRVSQGPTARLDCAAPNPLLAGATVTDRSDGTATAARPLGEGRKLMPPPARRPGKVTTGEGHSQMDWMRLQRTSSDLAGLKGKPLRRDITLEEVKRHSSRDDAWTVLRGKVYNITPYMPFHPGGPAQLQRGAGIDSSALFVKYHAWVNADMMLEKCLVGFLAKGEPETADLRPQP